MSKIVYLSSDKCNSFELKGKSCKISAICIFRKGIKPAWEEHENFHGGDFSGTIEVKDKNQMKFIWDKLVYRLIGSCYDYCENV